jgi:hypothetical protein
MRMGSFCLVTTLALATLVRLTMRLATLAVSGAGTLTVLATLMGLAVAAFASKEPPPTTATTRSSTTIARGSTTIARSRGTIARSSAATIAMGRGTTIAIGRGTTIAIGRGTIARGSGSSTSTAAHSFIIINNTKTFRNKFREQIL